MAESKNLGIVLPKRNNLRAFFTISKFSSKNKQIEDGKLVFDSFFCRDERLIFETDYVVSEDDPDRPGLDDFTKSIAEMFRDGLLEVPLAIYSPFPTLITGLPGEGKSVRMKQISAKISSIDEITEVPIFIKAKHLAKYVEKQETAEYMSESPDFRKYAEVIAKAFLDSNPLGKRLDEETVVRDLIEINSNVEDDDDCGLVLIVDAIDEIVEMESIQTLLHWLDDFSVRYGAGHSRCVISTRPSHEEFILDVFTSVNRFNMCFKKSTLQNQFPQNWYMNGELVELFQTKSPNLIQDNEVFSHIDKPLLIGWLCKFIKEGVELGDLKHSYNFYEKILDQAVNTRRFTTQSGFDDKELDSIKRMRDCIAFRSFSNGER